MTSSSLPSYYPIPLLKSPKDWKPWSFRISALLDQHELLGYITEEPSTTISVLEDTPRASREKAQVLNIIFSHIDDCQFTHLPNNYETIKSPYWVWMILKVENTLGAWNTLEKRKVYDRALEHAMEGFYKFERDCNELLLILNSASVKKEGRVTRESDQQQEKGRIRLKLEKQDSEEELEEFKAEAGKKRKIAAGIVGTGASGDQLARVKRHRA